MLPVCGHISDLTVDDALLNDLAPVPWAWPLLFQGRMAPSAGSAKNCSAFSAASCPGWLFLISSGSSETNKFWQSSKETNSKSRLEYWSFSWSFSCFRWFCFNECQHLKTPQWGWIPTKLSDVFWMLTLTLFNQEVTLKPRFHLQVGPEYRMKWNKTKLITQNMITYC